MWAFYTERFEIQDGCQVPILLHTDLRPTPAQFETWGRAGDRHLIASRIQLGEIDWAKKNRGISGSATDGIVAVGMEAVCDTTTNDAYLKSVTSRLKTVGPVNRLLITESRSNLIIGLHCSFDAPSARTFLLAVAHGASSKVEIPLDEAFLRRALKGQDVALNPLGHMAVIAALTLEGLADHSHKAGSSVTCAPICDDSFSYDSSVGEIYKNRDSFSTSQTISELAARRRLPTSFVAMYLQGASRDELAKQFGISIRKISEFGRSLSEIGVRKQVSYDIPTH
jgi:hypothetical protein